MALGAGARIGAYEVTALIGAGGMGEVYRARDTRLGRDVAIKVLPEAFATDAERLARFKREAQVLASLNHPHIAAIYGLEETPNGSALILELVDGPTLADRIAQGPIPLDETLPIAKQIADALEAAHEHGIIHRDLKPANLKLTPDGTVKVLDFGLAKALDTPATATALSQSPTITSPAMTMGGVILGTAAYMSPEQAKGKPVDKRSDIWAFGCVLYEMLTGKRAFQGEDVSETLASILKTSPDWGILPAHLPNHVTTVLKTCLEKDARRRFRNMGIVSFLLDQINAPARVPARSQRLIVTGGVMAAVVLVAAAYSFNGRSSVTPGVNPVQFSIDPTSEGVISGDVVQFAVAPDGRRIVLVGSSNGVPSLWLRDMSRTALTPLTGTTGASHPFWSSDGRAIGFFANERLKTIGVSGGPVVDICAADAPRGGAWNQHNEIVFGAGSVINRVSATGGSPQTLTKRDASKELSHGWPAFLPDGRHVLFLAWGLGQRELRLASIGSPDVTTLLRDVSRTVYADGHLLFAKSGALLAQRFDAESQRLSDSPVPVAEVIESGLVGLAPFAAAGSTLTYVKGANPSSQLVWRRRDGTRIDAASDAGDYRDLALSPDGTLAAVSMNNGPNRDVWTVDLPRQTRSRVTSHPGGDARPWWSPDGTRIGFTASRPDATGLYIIPAKGGTERIVFKKGGQGGVTSWSSDGRYALYYNRDGGTSDLWTVPLDGSGEPSPFAQTDADEDFGSFSPDGRRIAYMSSQSGRPEVYVQPFPPTGERYQLSSSGGTEPLWSSDGKEIFFVSPESRLMAVAVQGKGAEFQTLAAAPLFQVEGFSGGGRHYAVAPDRQRFLLITSNGARPLTVSVNWPALLAE